MGVWCDENPKKEFVSISICFREPSDCRGGDTDTHREAYSL